MMQLFCGDCLEILPTLTGIDAVITDPPYGIDINSSNRLSVSRGFGGQTWDKTRPTDAVKYIYSLFGNLPMVVWGGNYFTDILPPSRGWLAWDKLNDNRDFGELELAWTNIDQVIRRYRKFPVKMDGGKVHPTQKPIELMAWCIEKATPPNSTILDPFMGSGTTGVACVQTGRNFIGIEIDKTYFEIAKKRIEQAQLQIRMPI